MDFRAFCTDLCADDYPISANEERDSVLETVYAHAQPTKTDLASVFGITRQRVTQILSAREIRAA